uniref:Uncharacterized protein n=1 Tax=Arundo donax TaxID=35708 RepID=A0A0A9AJW0_ARUDO
MAVDFSKLRSVARNDGRHLADLEKK